MRETLPARVFSSFRAGGAAVVVRKLLAGCLAVALAIGVPLVSSWAAPVVSGAAVEPVDGGQRVVIALGASVPYQVFVLEHPDRVVLDLPEVQWGMEGAADLPTGGIVTGIRHGRYKEGTSRIVIDCRRPAAVRDVTLRSAGRGRWRLSVDLAGTGRRIDGRSSASAAASVRAAEAAPQPLRTAAEPVLIGATGLPLGDVGPARRSEAPPASLSVPLIAPTPAERVLQSAFAAPRPRPAAPRRPAAPLWVVAVDAGHGGQDPGAIGPGGVYEKTLTLATARALRDELAALHRYKVVLTRNRDVFIPLRGRIAIARAAGADLFVSLHADKAENPAVRGLSVYTLSERASDAESAALAEKENKVDLLGGFRLKGQTPEVTNILIELAQRDTMNQSAQMASLLVRELGDETSLLPKTHRFAGFAVLKAPDVPSALIELGYLSNPSDQGLLRSPDHRRRLAHAIARAIDGYFVTWEARNRS